MVRFWNSLKNAQEYTRTCHIGRKNKGRARLTPRPIPGQILHLKLQQFARRVNCEPLWRRYPLLYPVDNLLVQMLCHVPQFSASFRVYVCTYRLKHWSELCKCIYEQTHSRQCCNLFISWLWTQTVIVLRSVVRACVGLRWSTCSTPQPTPRRLPVLRVYAMFEGLREFLLHISIWFLCHFAEFHVANRVVIIFATNVQMYEEF